MFTFSSSLGISAIAFMQEDIVNTDMSILPFANEVQENITHIPEYFTPAYFLPKAGENLA